MNVWGEIYHSINAAHRLHAGGAATKKAIVAVKDILTAVLMLFVLGSMGFLILQESASSSRSSLLEDPAGKPSDQIAA